MFERHCTRGSSALIAGLLAACVLASGLVADAVEAQTVIEGYRVTLSRFGGDATLPRDIGFVCLWDDGIWTMTDFIDIGYFVIVGNKTYLLGGVEGEEHLSWCSKSARAISCWERLRTPPSCPVRMSSSWQAPAGNGVISAVRAERHARPLACSQLLRCERPEHPGRSASPACWFGAAAPRARLLNVAERAEAFH